MKLAVDRVKGIIVECNTAYKGARNTTKAHKETMKLHGWTDIAEVDILDKELELAISDAHKIQKNFVGDHIKNYDSMLVPSHFMRHPMGGFDGG